MLRFVLKGTDNEIMEFLRFLNQHFESDDDKQYIMHSKDSGLTILHESDVVCDNSDFVFIDYNSLRNDLNDIFKNIRKDLCDEAVCGLCQFNGDSITECPGFDRDDCFELKVYFLEKYLRKE